MSDEPNDKPAEPTPPDAPKTPADELKDGLWKVLGAAKRMVDELPTKPIEELVQKTADAAKEAAKDLPLERIAASPTFQRISTTVESGAREVGRALENVTHAAWDSVRGRPADRADDQRRERVEDDDDAGRGSGNGG